MLSLQLLSSPTALRGSAGKALWGVCTCQRRPTNTNGGPSPQYSNTILARPICAFLLERFLGLSSRIKLARLCTLAILHYEAINLYEEACQRPLYELDSFDLEVNAHVREFLQPLRLPVEFFISGPSQMWLLHMGYGRRPYMARLYETIALGPRGKDVQHLPPPDDDDVQCK